jgi:acetyl-CoA acetyltransferase
VPPLTEILIAGVGMHPFGRYPHASLKDLVRVAVIRALLDADLHVKDVEAAYAANAMAGLLQGQEQIRGQCALRDVGIERIPIVNVENACASGSTAFREAMLAIRAGAADVVLAVGFEKMFVDDRERSLDALETAADLDVVGGLGLQFTAVYALRLQHRLADGSLTLDDLADVSVKSHYNGSLNPYAAHQAPVTRAQVIESRRIADPLTLLMCSSISDGAAAVVLMRAGRAKPNGRPRITVRASVATSGFTTDGSPEPSVSSLAARKAYDDSSIGPHDLDVVEVHDAMAPGELLYYEHLGLCEPGGAAELLRSGATGLNGRIPVNPSGGLVARGHPVGATGLAQLAELTWQLRGEADRRQVSEPRIGLAQNSGGWLEGESAACNVHILERTTAWH